MGTILGRGSARTRARTKMGLQALICVCGLTLGASAMAVAESPTSFDIAAQPLTAALKAYAAQAKVQLLYSSDAVGAISGNAVIGGFEKREALARLLKGTGLEAVYSGEDRVTIRESSTSSSSSSSPERSEDLKLEEVVVTAQKREERLLDVPASISAITQQDINRRGLVSAEDYLRSIPGVNQGTSVSGSSVVIRGIETSPVLQNFSSGATVATYFGETSTTGSGGLASNGSVDLKLVDVERVEVLRGPQGTAFGDASLGGAVRTIPVAPRTDRFEGKLATSYSNTSRAGGTNYMAQGVVNLPLVADRFAVRAVGYDFVDSGFYRNVAGADAPLLSATAAYGASSLAAATNANGLGKAQFKGGRVAALFNATDDLTVLVSALKQETTINGYPATNVGTSYDQSSLQVASEHMLRGQRYGVADTDVELANLTVTYDLDWARLVGTYSYVDGGSDLVRGYSVFANAPDQFGYALPLSQYAPSSHVQRAGEVRLVTKLDGPWNFLGGVYVERTDDRTRFGYIWYGDPDLNLFGAGRYTGNQADYNDARHLKQKAVFGEVSWEFLPRLTLTAGGRFYDYDRDVDVTTQGTLFGDSVTSNQTSKSGNNFRGSLDYKPNDSSTVYASWSQGFRLGKPQPGLAPGECDLNNDGFVDGTQGVTIASTRSVDSDTVDSYEIGGKVSTSGGRVLLTAAAFRVEWDGMPFLTQASACMRDYLANAGRARSEGVETQATFNVSQALRLDLGASYVRARLTQDVPAQGLASGDRLPGSPKINANAGLQYEFDVASHKSFVRADSVYVGKFSSSLPYSAQTVAGNYVTANLKGGTEFGALGVNLFVNNLTDADDYTFRNNADVAGYRLRPRTFGLELSYVFE